MAGPVDNCETPGTWLSASMMLEEGVCSKVDLRIEVMGTGTFLILVAPEIPVDQYSVWPPCY